ncbi:MAG: M1 family aminopeptidase [Vicinamibacterales bacterium]|nr:M1 family aminopeptidase [Vicinamibacterales bacterium]
MRMRSLLAGLLLGLAATPLAADTYPRQPGLDALHYAFTLTLAGDSAAIAAEAQVTLRLMDAAVREVTLDLVAAADGTGMTVASVTAGGRPIAFTHADDRLRLPLPPGLARGGQVTYTIRYGGVPREGLRVHTNLHGARVVFSENWPHRARHWLPMIDHPYDKATGEFLVTAPASYQVISNGRLIETRDLPEGRRLTHWRQSAPIPSWLYALAAAPFSVHHAGDVHGIPLQTWVFPEDRDTGRALFEETTRRAMAFFIERIGPYPYEKLANIQATGMGGGVEYASAIFYGEKGVAAGTGPVVHEVAHQWWGNAVTEDDWDDVWLSEGFATYFTLLYTEHVEGRDAFVDGLRRSRATVLQTELKLPGTPIVHRNLDDMTRVLNALVYQKGAWVLHMLRAEVGTTAFWEGMREWYARYRVRNASTDDLRRVMEGVSGRDLTPFFAQWLTRSGVPRLEGQWRYDAATRQVTVTVRQTQEAEAYQLPIEIGLGMAGQDVPRLERVALTGREATFTLASDTEPQAVTLDPDTWLLFDPGPFTREP